MRKYFGGLVVGSAIAMFMLVPGTALATHSNGQGPDKDFQNGAHKTNCPTPFGTFPCHSHTAAQGFSATGTGVPAKGHWTLSIFTGGFLGLPDPVVLSGEVTCFNAIGNSGHVRQRIDQSNTPLAPPGFTIIGRAIDNGEGANDPEDESTGFLAPPGTTCPPLALTTSPIEQGNIVVHDGI
jgi:hypothetical protein